MLDYPALVILLAFPSYGKFFLMALDTKDPRDYVAAVFYLFMAAVLGACLKHIVNKKIHTEKEDLPYTDDLVTEENCKVRVATVNTTVSGVKSELKTEISGVKSELKTEISGVKSELKSEIKLIIIKQTETNDLLKEIIRKLK